MISARSFNAILNESTRRPNRKPKDSTYASPLAHSCATHKQRAGSTLVMAIEQYAHTLQCGGATLMLADVRLPLHAQRVKTGAVEICGSERVFIEVVDVFAATHHALQMVAENR